MAVCAHPYGNIHASDLCDLMLETAIALDPDTPDYRAVKVRVRVRTDNFDVSAYSDQLARKYEDS